MTEEQLADLLAQHLDLLLESGALPDDLPAEVAELLNAAQNLSAAAPAPRPEFGPALKASLVGSTGGGNGATPAAGSALAGQTITVVVIALLAGAALLALLVSLIILGFIQTDRQASTPAPIQTRIAPIPAATAPAPPPLSTEPIPTSQATLASTPTATPLVDMLHAIKVTVEIIIEPPALAPGPGGGGDGGSSGSGGGGGDDHDRGHGNDPDHHDEDNPGHGDDD
jgi:hypothetical protein